MSAATTDGPSEREGDRQKCFPAVAVTAIAIASLDASHVGNSGAGGGDG